MSLVFPYCTQVPKGTTGSAAEGAKLGKELTALMESIPFPDNNFTYNLHLVCCRYAHLHGERHAHPAPACGSSFVTTLIHDPCRVKLPTLTQPHLGSVLPVYVGYPSRRLPEVTLQRTWNCKQRGWCRTTRCPRGGEFHRCAGLPRRLVFIAFCTKTAVLLMSTSWPLS